MRLRFLLAGLFLFATEARAQGSFSSAILAELNALDSSTASSRFTSTYRDKSFVDVGSFDGIHEHMVTQSKFARVTFGGGSYVYCYLRIEALRAAVGSFRVGARVRVEGRMQTLYKLNPIEKRSIRLQDNCTIAPSA